MANGDTRLWASLERRSAAIFLVAGVLFSGFVIVNVLARFTDMTGTWLGVAEIGAGFLGLVAALVAVVGLYPRLHDRVPRLSGAGVLAFVVAVLGLVVSVVWLVGGIGLENAPEAVPIALTALFSVSVLLIAVGFSLFATACLRANTPSRTIGYLLFVPVIMWIWHYVALAIFGSTRIGTIIDYTVIAAAFLAIWYLLRTGSGPTDRGEPTPDSAA